MNIASEFEGERTPQNDPGRRCAKEPTGLRSCHGIDADCDRQEKCIVLIRLNLDSVRFLDPEPFLRNGRDRLTVLFNLILMINEVAVRMHIGAALNFDLEPISNTDERFSNSRLAVRTLNRHRVAHCEFSLLDLGDLRARGITQHECLANPHRLAVDLERTFPGVGFYPVIVAYGEQLLAHLIPMNVRIAVVAISKPHGDIPFGSIASCEIPQTSVIPRSTSALRDGPERLLHSIEARSDMRRQRLSRPWAS